MHEMIIYLVWQCCFKKSPALPKITHKVGAGVTCIIFCILQILQCHVLVTVFDTIILMFLAPFQLLFLTFWTIMLVNGVYITNIHDIYI